MSGLLGKWWGKALFGLAVVFVAIQFVPMSVDNPSARDQPEWDSAQTKKLFDAACADCHSNRTNVLWFEHVAPVKWFVAHHVEEGRQALNVDQWHTKPGRGLDELTEVIKNKRMPIDSYTWLGLHSDAKLTDTQRQQLIDGLKATVAADPPGSSGGSGD